MMLGFSFRLVVVCICLSAGIGAWGNPIESSQAYAREALRVLESSPVTIRYQQKIRRFYDSSQILEILPTQEALIENRNVVTGRADQSTETAKKIVHYLPDTGPFEDQVSSVTEIFSGKIQYLEVDFDQAIKLANGKELYAWRRQLYRFSGAGTDILIRSRNPTTKQIVNNGERILQNNGVPLSYYFWPQKDLEVLTKVASFGMSDASTPDEPILTMGNSFQVKVNAREGYRPASLTIKSPGGGEKITEFLKTVSFDGMPFPAAVKITDRKQGKTLRITEYADIQYERYKLAEVPEIQFPENTVWANPLGRLEGVRGKHQ